MVRRRFVNAFSLSSSAGLSRLRVRGEGKGEEQSDE